LNEDAVAIHIRWIKETAGHGDTIPDKQIAQELGCKKGIVRFLLAQYHTAPAHGPLLTMVSAP